METRKQTLKAYEVCGKVRAAWGGTQAACWALGTSVVLAGLGEV